MNSKNHTYKKILHSEQFFSTISRQALCHFSCVKVLLLRPLQLCNTPHFSLPQTLPHKKRD